MIKKNGYIKMAACCYCEQVTKFVHKKDKVRECGRCDEGHRIICGPCGCLIQSCYNISNKGEPLCDHCEDEEDE